MDKTQVKEINEKAGMRLRRVRTFLGLTEEQMGEKLGVSVAVYRGFEKGSRSMNARYFATLIMLSPWADPDYIISGKYSYDLYIEAALKKLPETEHTRIIELVREMAHDLDEGIMDENSIFGTCSDLIKYGMEHIWDVDVRECKPIHLFTDMFEQMLAEKNME